MTTVSDRDVITVLGGGLTGLLLSLLLARRGFPVRVIDRGPDPRTTAGGGGRSINLALAERGRTALRHAGILADVMPLTIAMTGRELHADDGTRQFQPYGQFAGEQIYSIGRHALTVTLAEANDRLGVALWFGERCTDIDVAGHRLTLTARDGNQHSVGFRTLIAADGAGSLVRRQLNDEAGFGATESLLDHGYKELSIPATGYGWYRLAPNALHIWPRGGHMLIALPNLDADFTATLFLAQSGTPSFDALATADRVSEFFATHYPTASALMTSLANDFGEHPVGVMGTIRCKRWHKADDVLLVGDAAHAIVPFHGQGMNAAFEDCRILDDLIATIGPQWGRVFERFEAERRPNTNAIADMALENYIEMRDSVRDATFHLKKALAFELEQREPEHFVPRYSMVMFHPEISYADAQRRGAIQSALLTEFTANATTLADVDVAEAAAAVRERLNSL